MKEPWSNIEKETFSDEDRQILRYQMQVFFEREPMMRRIALVYRGWPFVIVGIVLAGVGSVPGVATFLAKIVGLL